MWLAASAEGAQLFRNNVAQAVVGKVLWIKGGEQSVTVRPGDAVVRNARVLHAGLFEGSGDLIGQTPVLITPDLVGRTFGVFTSLEAKFNTGKPTTEQKTWAKGVRAGGGFAGTAYTVGEAVALVRMWRRGASADE